MTAQEIISLCARLHSFATPEELQKVTLSLTRNEAELVCEHVHIPYRADHVRGRIMGLDFRVDGP